MTETANKSRHGLRAWLCFFFGLNIIFMICAAAFIGLADLSDSDFNSIDDFFDLAIREKFQDTRLFNSLVSEHMSCLLNLSKITSPPYNRTASPYLALKIELTNIACFVQNKEGMVIYDTLPKEYFTPAGETRYDYLILVRENTMKLYQSDTDDLVGEYLAGNISGHEVPINSNLALLSRNFEDFKESYTGSGDVLIVYALRTNPEKHPDSSLYILSMLRLWLRIGTVLFLLIVITAIILFVYSSVRRNDKNHFLKRYAAFAAKVWFEFKLVLLCVVFAAFVALHGEFSHHSIHYFSPEELALISVFFILCFWFFYFLVKDLQYNKGEFFRHNSIRTLSRIVGTFMKRFPFERRMVAGFWILFAGEIILLLLFFISVSSMSGFWAALFALTGIVLFLVAATRYHRFIADAGKLVEQINRIKSGDLTTRLKLDLRSDLHEYARNLDSIQTGMSRALEERLASERLKVDLITNVSHDLKTPLTSIISYIDLMKKEDLPPRAVEYVSILSQKAGRLKTMIQDIFDVSKATSGNLAVEKEHLDLCRLVDQTLADMQERIDASGLEFRVRHIREPLIINSDGQKLYRVFQNLIDNALRYSLKGSRVYIRLWAEDDRAMVEVKNTSSLELDFTPGQITERFVRGDASRSGDGSGLGLSIAQTFTEACGGSFKISVDYDDFRVRLAFPLEPVSGNQHFTTGKAVPDAGSASETGKTTVQADVRETVDVTDMPENTGDSIAADVSGATHAESVTDLTDAAVLADETNMADTTDAADATDPADATDVTRM